MGGYASPHPPQDASAAHPPSRGSLSIAYLVAAAVIIGCGTFLTCFWIITLTWAYLGGVVLLAIGGLMLFSPRAGANEA